MSLTKVSYSMIAGAPANVFDYMTANQIAAVQSGTYGSVTDSEITAAINAAIADVYGVDKSGYLVIPEGTYQINSSLVATGSSSTSLYFIGQGNGNGFVGTTFKWTGVAGGVVFDFKGISTSTIGGFSINGNSLALWGFHLSSNQAAGGAGTTQVTFKDIYVGNVTGTNSSGFVFGDANTYQVSEITVENCKVASSAGAIDYGLLTGGGNTENFTIRKSNFVGCKFGIAVGKYPSGAQAAGYVLIESCGFGAATTADIYSNAPTTNIVCCYSEASAAFVTALTGVSVSGSRLSIRNCAYNGYYSDYDANYVVSYLGGTLSIQDSTFIVIAASSHQSSVPRIQAASNGSPSTLGGAGGQQSFYSANNYYNNVPDFVRVYDGSNNALFGTANYITKDNVNQVRIVSINDTGNSAGAICGLMTQIGNIHTLAAKIGGESVASGVTQVNIGRVSQNITKIQIDYTTFKAASTSEYYIIASLGAGIMVKGVICDTVTAYAGLAGTIEISVGWSASANEAILAHNVKAAPVVKGLLDADLGAGLSKAGTSPSIGVVTSWSSTNDVLIKLVSGTGNMGNGTATLLSAGLTNVYLITESVKY